MHCSGSLGTESHFRIILTDGNADAATDGSGREPAFGAGCSILRIRRRN
jgi:hypothetical protein